MVKLKKKEVKNYCSLEKLDKKSLKLITKHPSDPFKDKKYVLKPILPPPFPRPCRLNPKRDVGLIPYMSPQAAQLLASYGFQASTDFYGLDIYATYDSIVCGQSGLEEWEKQTLMNGLRIAVEYANGRVCQYCCQVEILLNKVPGLSATAAKILIKVFGTAKEVKNQITITTGMSGVGGADWVWYLYDYVFTRVDLCPQEAKLLHEGLTYAVHLVNQTKLISDPGGSTGRTPPG
jgi:hypothetical protein